jgi:phage-related protein
VGRCRTVTRIDTHAASWRRWGLDQLISYFSYMSCQDAALQRHTLFIILPMSVWSFMDFIDSKGGNPFYEWLSALPLEAQAAIDQRILTMAAMEFWPEGYVSAYKSAPGILELRISSNRVKYRPLGVYSSTTRRRFVLLHGAIEKGGKIPRGDLKAAMDRLRTLEREPTRVGPHRFAA